MKPLLCLFAILCVLLICCPDDSLAGKKKKTKRAKKGGPSGKSGKLDSKTLKCLVCRATVEEYLWAVLKVDPKKMVDTGTWRVDKTGSQQRHVVRVLVLETYSCERYTKISFCDNILHA